MRNCVEVYILELVPLNVRCCTKKTRCKNINVDVGFILSIFNTIPYGLRQPVWEELLEAGLCVCITIETFISLRIVGLRGIRKSRWLALDVLYETLLQFGGRGVRILGQSDYIQ